MFKWILRRLNKYIVKRMITDEFAESLAKGINDNSKLFNITPNEAKVLAGVIYNVIRRVVMGINK